MRNHDKFKRWPELHKYLELRYHYESWHEAPLVQDDGTMRGLDDAFLAEHIADPHIPLPVFSNEKAEDIDTARPARAPIIEVMSCK